jgi:hypothetical protein
LVALVIARQVGLHPQCPDRWFSGRFGNRFLWFVSFFLVVLPDFGDRSCRLRFSRRLAVLGQLFQFGFEFGLPCRDLLRQFFSCVVAQACEFLDAQRFQIDFCHAGLPFSFGYREGAQATSTTPILSTANTCANRMITILQRPVPIRAPIRFANGDGKRIKKGMGMTEQEDRLARERKEIAARIASFKATQEKFKREREEYYVTTLENARNGSNGKSFWS